MEVIDKILNEWSFRCHDGIVDMNDPKKIAILNEILGFDLDEAKVDMEKIWNEYFKDAEVETTVKRNAYIYVNGKATEDFIEAGEQVITQPIPSYKSKIPVKYNGNTVNILISTINTDLEPEEDTIDYYLWVLKNEANIKDQSVLDEIKEIYIRNNDESNFKNNFRKKEDVNQSNLDEIYNAFKAYIGVGSKKRGVGKGEYTVLLGLNKSESGGTAEKDIMVGKDVYEVKELAGREFRTGSSGYITTTDFKNHFDYLVSLLVKIAGKNLTDLKELGNKVIENYIIEIIEYYKGTYKSGNISEGILIKIKELTEKLHNYFKENKKDYDDAIPIKIGDIKFLISQDTFNKIKSGDLKTVNLGTELLQQKSNLYKLKNHPWVEKPEEMSIEFNNIWLKYLDSISGFIIYDGNKLNLYSPKTIEKNFSPIRVVQNQINITKK